MTDTECNYLNNKCIQPCICKKDSTNNIFKVCNSQNVFEWEAHIYLSFLDSELFPQVSASNQKIMYLTSGMVSLRTYLNTKPKYSSFVLNELFSFVKSFKSHCFLHGNLHIDNVFLFPGTFKSSPRFFVIDYANSYNLNDVTSKPKYKRTSYIGEFENKIRKNHLMVWDYVTMFLSLKIFYKNELRKVLFVEKLVTSYVPRAELDSLLVKYVEQTTCGEGGLFY
jgi:hypothetical protein